MRFANGPWILAGLVAGLAVADAPPSERWEPEIRAFEARDHADPPKAGGIVFVGSSSIRLWTTLTTDYPGVDVVNRGFGGSEIADATHFAGRIIVPCRPRQVVLYAGDNDLMNGKTPAQVADAFRAFVERVRADLPQIRVSFIAIKPSPARASLLDVAREANVLVRAYAATRRDVDFIDIFTPMLDGSGKPRAELFVEDRLHLNADGYRLWRSIVAPYLDGAPVR
jgi:lysophospholipase L1-like esterase